ELRAPYGAWEARGRVDPGGGWRPRPLLAVLRWGLLALAHLGLALRVRQTGAVWPLAVVAALLLLAVRRRLRPLAWSALAGLSIVEARALGLSGPGGDLALLHAGTLDGGGMPRRSPRAPGARWPG